MVTRLVNFSESTVAPAKGSSTRQLLFSAGPFPTKLPGFNDSTSCCDLDYPSLPWDGSCCSLLAFCSFQSCSTGLDRRRVVQWTTCLPTKGLRRLAPALGCSGSLKSVASGLPDGQRRAEYHRHAESWTWRVIFGHGASLFLWREQQSPFFKKQCHEVCSKALCAAGANSSTYLMPRGWRRRCRS